MAKKIRPGGTINGYEIVELLHQGALALSYQAVTRSNERVFLKQYKSPTVAVAWYRDYVQYQQELKRRIETTAARRFTYRLIDFFEADWGHRCYFQVFEFVEEGHDLEKALDQMRADPASVSWEQRVTFSKVIMASVNALHGAGVIHCDLKPPNIQLFKDDTIDAGYVVKLIDMDYSILHDRQAPWHGHQGYVGSPNYFSPEHLRPGGAPLAGSDVFTCGLILYEMLAQGHPYRFDSPEEYHKAVLAYSVPRPRLIGTMPAPANNAHVQEVLYCSLSPDASQRPTAKEVVMVLNGLAAPPARGAAGTAAVAKSPVARPSAPAGSGTSTGRPPKPSPPPPDPSRIETPAPKVGQELSLVNEAGQAIRMRVTTEVGKHLVRSLGADHIYFDTQQLTLERGDDSQWYVRHHPSAKHQTLLNGKRVGERTPIHAGDILAVGSEEREIQKLRLGVQLS